MTRRELVDDGGDAADEILQGVGEGEITDPDILAELQAVAVDDKVLNAARLIAEKVIADAIAAAGAPEDIEETQRMLAKGNSQATECAEGPHSNRARRYPTEDSLWRTT